MLRDFHPSVAHWFTREFGRPTEVQSMAWPAIREGNHTLIAAPTGSGKTLAAFLAVLDRLVRHGLNGRLADRTDVVYVSPLRALSNDIERNLQRPLAGIREELRALDLPDVPLRVLVRTGDTPASQRTAMLKRPPHILVTTPESLYLLLTSENGRKMLSAVRTFILDEIHALVRDKRGSHLSLSIERLEHLVGQPLTRIGLSATQKPIDEIARFLVGHRPDGPDNGAACTIIDTGHRRQLDLAIEVPGSPLTTVMATEVWGEVYDRLVELIREHQTTLIFVNTRRMAERISFQLKEKLGADLVAAHHGSMSREHRQDAERRLKSGALRALVATASLELGIDIGSVDLVCQMGSPKSIATFLQRVGRSGHTIAGTPKGRLFPLTRDELVECAAVLDAVRRGELDRLRIPHKPLDILAQQIVAEVSNREYEEEELFQLIRRAYPFRGVTRDEFDELVAMLSHGFTHRRGQRGAYLHHDAVNRRIRARKAARLSAITSGGAIPDSFDYEVILEPSNTFIGTLNEDYAFESMAGDVFQLANRSWQIRRIENGVVRVTDASEAPPSIPFWLGEAPGRSDELSFAVSRLRSEIQDRMPEPSELERRMQGGPDESWKGPAVEWLIREVGLGAPAADQVVTYLALSRVALSVLPTQQFLAMERFFDEAGDMHLVIHSPYGSRINRAWGLALRKRFCRKFNFELQAAAGEDAIVLSLGSTHSFPLEEVFGYLSSKGVRSILVQALLDAPMFEVRWRWNASRALAVLRRRNGKRVPAQIQRMHAQDLVAVVFPDQLACLENIAGDREVPDHPLVRQTIQDCLTEAMDIEGLESLLQRIERGDVQWLSRDLRESSPLAQEILNSRPYTFLDDAPIEERRTRAVASRRWLDATDASSLADLDPEAIRTIQLQAWPQAETPDELHDALMTLGYLTPEEIKRGDGTHDWKRLLDHLVNERRAAKLTAGRTELWTATERLPRVERLYDSFQLSCTVDVPARFRDASESREQALEETLRGRLEGLGPVRSSRLAVELDVSETAISSALAALEAEGFAFRGRFTPGVEGVEWCERRLLARIHRFTLEKLRRDIEPVCAADCMRFLFAWHRIEPGQRPEGPDALEVVLQQLEGFDAPAAAWESELLPARVADYDHTWLDLSCLSGRTTWGRFRRGGNGKSAAPIRTTPIMLVQRDHAETWTRLFDGGGGRSALTTPASNVLEVLQERGACFFDELVRGTRLLRSQVEDALGELVAGGYVTSDSFVGLRALLVPGRRRPSSQRHRASPFEIATSGRWSLIHRPAGAVDSAADLVARTLLRRYGVMFRKLWDREAAPVPWRDLAKVFRTWEARGEIRGGRFVDGVWGEQFALPEAVTRLRAVRREQPDGRLVSVGVHDPLNLHGLLTPGDKMAPVLGNRILYRDGAAIAVAESGQTTMLAPVDAGDEWTVKQALIRRPVPPKLRAYLGKGIG